MKKSNTINNEIYNKWYKSPYLDKEMKNEMMLMSSDDIDVWFTNEPLSFGTAGYRAPMGPGPRMLNKYTYQQLAVGYAKYILSQFETKNDKKNKKPRVFVGHDNRKNGKEFAQLVANTLTAFNIEVITTENNISIATPIVSFIVRNLCLDGAINITASHNPKEYNGFKAYNSHGAQLTNQEAEIVTKFLPDHLTNLSREYNYQPKLITTLDHHVLVKYYNSIKKVLNITKYKNEKKPVVITPHHGVGCLYVEDFLKSLGHNIVMEPTQSFEDSNFTNSKYMNPEENESFANAILTANKIKSNFVLGIDPDADRVAIAIKEKGNWRYLDGNEIGILITYYILTNKQFNGKVPVIISTYVTNTLINKIAAEYDGLILRTGTGFKNIASAMEHIESENSEYVIGFEEAIGVNISLDTREKDAIAASAMLIEMYNYYMNQGISLVQVLESRIYLRYGKWIGKSVALKIHGSNWKQKATELEKRALSLKENERIGSIRIKDVFWNSAGGCIEWKINEDSWIKFRVSGTEPKFKIYYNLFINDSATYYEFNKYNLLIKKLTKIIKGKLSK